MTTAAAAAAVVALGLVPGVALGAAPCGSGGTLAISGSTESCTYTIPGEDTFAVPAGVSAITVSAVGGAGGTGGSAFGFTNGGLGGEGALVSSSVPVTPSSNLFVEVGSDGAAGTDGLAGQNVCPGGPAGGNGGGQGGDGRCELGGGGGGGGASDIRTSPASANGLTAGAGDPRLLVAGGGGGGGGQGNFFTTTGGGAGGNAGGSATTGAGAGGDASDLNCDDVVGGAGGPGQVGPGGGAAGTTACQHPVLTPTLGGTGVAGDGGAGGDGNAADGGGAGAGGGGYVGGGGGTALVGTGAGGGGGGSSAGPLGATFAATTDAPSVRIAWTLAVPTASIAVPAPGATFAVGQTVASSFTCTGAVGGAGLQSCLDQDARASGAALDTATPGVHTLAVTATEVGGQTAQVSRTYTVAAPPSAGITAPATNQTFAVGQRVPTRFACSEGASGPGIATCTDSLGAGSSAGALDTSQPGTFTYGVTATSHDGQTTAATITYAVARAPSVQSTTPTAGARYTRGQRVTARYSCQEGSGGPGVASCAGTVASGRPLPTSTTGRHRFTITATSQDGQATTTSIAYTVTLPDNHFSVAHTTTNAVGAIGFAVKVPGPGRIDVLETAWNDNLERAAVLLRPATRRFVYARVGTTATAGGVVHLHVAPNARGTRLVGHRTYQVTLRLWVTYTPSGGRARSIGFYGLHLP
jgi:hypothetical protein